MRSATDELRKCLRIAIERQAEAEADVQRLIGVLDRLGHRTRLPVWLDSAEIRMRHKIGQSNAEIAAAVGRNAGVVSRVVRGLAG